MKNGCITMALCLPFLLVPSCRKSDGVDAPKVAFSAWSTLSTPTKTAYEGGYTPTGRYERLNWVAGDKLAILSPQAILVDKNTRPWTVSTSSDNPRYSVSDYSITADGTPDGRYSASGVTDAGSAGGLHWGEGKHLFFGVYPAPGYLPEEIKSVTGITTNAGGTQGIISAFIPKAQTYSRVADAVKSKKNGSVDSTHIYPRMQYAWMGCAQYVPAAGGDVRLFFSPMITTFQLALAGEDEEEIALTRFELFSVNDPLQGAFTAAVGVKDAATEITHSNLGDMQISYSGIGTPASSNNQVSFSFPAGTKVSSRKKVTLSVFVYPRGANGSAYIDGLTVRFFSDETVFSLKLMDAAKENWVQFPAGCKINIDGLTLPRQSKPWTFSIYGGYMETEPSDVAVTPVQVEEWSRFNYPWDLDEW